ncbi:hypothetical protein DFH06DRAFT_1392722 [Mycena polygramma]|nr:hypothetical protein DFH06DRAFT_1392722 [Mycena polygramma]
MRLTLLISTLLSVIYVAALPREIYERAKPLDAAAVIKQCTAKGIEILSEIADATGDTPGLTEKYNTLYAPLSSRETVDKSEDETEEIREVLAEAGLQVSDQFFKYVVQRSRRDAAAYTNYFDIAEGIIVADSNFNYLFFYDQSQQKSLPKYGLRKDEPNALGWNQIVGEQYKTLANRDVSSLKHILRFNIGNEGTLAVVKAFLEMPTLPKDSAGWTVLSPGQVEFNALLGTDNGKGGGRMLKDYKASMPGRSLKAIRIKKRDIMYHMIEDYV